MILFLKNTDVVCGIPSEMVNRNKHCSQWRIAISSDHNCCGQEAISRVNFINNVASKDEWEQQRRPALSLHTFRGRS